VQTAVVNAALRELVAIRQPPQQGGAEVKLLYGAQVSVEPPTFAIVTSRPEAIAESYRRYLVNGLRDRFGFRGSPIRVRFTRRRRRGSE
jgi:GTP-binding protein